MAWMQESLSSECATSRCTALDVIHVNNNSIPFQSSSSSFNVNRSKIVNAHIAGKSGTNFSGGRSAIFCSPTLGLFLLHTVNSVITLHAVELALMIQNVLCSSERMWFLPACPNFSCMCLRMSVDTWDCLGIIAGNLTSSGKAALDKRPPTPRTQCFYIGSSWYRVLDFLMLVCTLKISSEWLAWTYWIMDSSAISKSGTFTFCPLSKIFNLLLESFPHVPNYRVASVDCWT